MVGRLSGIGTVGAIVGTVVTGFVLISRVPVSGILVGLGVALVVASAFLEWRLGRRRPASGPLLGVVAGGLAMTVAPGGCDTESTYHCVVHSYVDLEDPTLLVFACIRVIASVTDAAYPGGEALRVYHLGGRWADPAALPGHVRPGTHNLVSEIDGGVVEVDRERLVRAGRGRHAGAPNTDSSAVLSGGSSSNPQTNRCSGQVIPPVTSRRSSRGSG